MISVISHFRSNSLKLPKSCREVSLWSRQKAAGGTEPGSTEFRRTCAGGSRRSPPVFVLSIYHPTPCCAVFMLQSSCAAQSCCLLPLRRRNRSLCRWWICSCKYMSPHILCQQEYLNSLFTENLLTPIRSRETQIHTVELLLQLWVIFASFRQDVC